MATILLAFTLLIESAFAQEQCSAIRPLYVDLHDRNVSNGEANIQYGLFIGVGTPSQNQSLWPSIRRNETTFSGPDLCGSGSSQTCAEQTHGIYIPGQSSSFQNETGQSIRVRDNTSIAPTEVLAMGNDTLNIWEHYFDPSPPNVTHVENLPLTQLTNYDSENAPWFGPSGQLGLGADASLLQLLLDQGSIATRSFGLYIGTMYPRAGGSINGSLTLGGYDSGRLEGEPHNFTLATDYNTETGETPFRVRVDSISINNLSNNNDSSILTSTPFDAYITTDQYSMSFPDSVTAAFVEQTSSDSEPRNNDFSEPSFYLPDSANFSLTITLSTGLSITIPPEELRNVSNASPISPPQDVQSNTNSTTPGPSLLGTSFLAHLYLSVNYDAQPEPAFYLNRALPHGPYVMTQPLCAAVDSVPLEAKPVVISSFNRNGMIGAILGGVIGGIALVVLIWWCWIGQRWRRLRGRQSPDEGLDNAAKGSWDGEEGDSPQGQALVGGKRARAAAYFTGGAKGRGKGKARALDGAEYPPASQASHARNDSGSSDEEGHEMQSFAPVAVPAAYSDPGQQTEVRYDPAPSSVSEELPLPTNDEQQQQQRQFPPPESIDIDTIGQAISTPPLDHDHDHNHFPTTPTRTLRSISPVSPISPLLPATPSSTTPPPPHFILPSAATTTTFLPPSTSEAFPFSPPLSVSAQQASQAEQQRPGTAPPPITTTATTTAIPRKPLSSSSSHPGVLLGKVRSLEEKKPATVDLSPAKQELDHHSGLLELELDLDMMETIPLSPSLVNTNSNSSFGQQQQVGEARVGRRVWVAAADGGGG